MVQERIECTPHISASCLAVNLSGESPIIGTAGLSLAARFAVAPDLVYVKIALASTVFTTCEAAELIASEVVCCNLFFYYQEFVGMTDQIQHL